MFIINVRYIVKPGKREDYIEAVKKTGFITDCQNEEGNKGYDFYLPIDSSDDVFVIEKWEKKANWEAHKMTKHVEKYQDVKKEYVLDMKGEVFETNE